MLMYARHFRFNAKPFQISTDPSFLWLGEQHKEGLAILEYGIEENKGVIVLTGGVGTGKTTLINALMQRIKSNVIAAVVSDPGLEPMDFFYYIANLYGIANRLNSKLDFLYHFDVFLRKASQQKKKVLLIIDEAQRIEAKLMEEIRLLSNIEKSGERLLNVFLVGQNELNAMLQKSENRSFKQRIAIQFNIVPLTLDGVHAYIGYRLGVAGCRRQIFTDDAISKIFALSKGYPRLINVICDHCLISAFVQNSRKVTADMVVDSVKEFQFSRQAPSNPPIPNAVIKNTTAGAPVAPSVHSDHWKENKRNQLKNEKNVFSFSRLAYMGFLLALVIFSGYLLNRYRKDARTRPTTAQSASPQVKHATLNTVNDKASMIEAAGRRSSVYAGRFSMPTESPREQRSEAAKGVAASVPAAVPSGHRTASDEGLSGSGGASGSPGTEASPPALSNDKDPGAIIDWLIRKQKRHAGE